jgi:transcription initiation factor TFIIIB Brf1 subunit/transcription initiation factor TFIIB
MSDFETFAEIMKTYEKQKKVEKVSETQVCSHQNTINEKGLIVCVDCGEEIQEKISLDKDWRYYGQSGDAQDEEIARVQLRNPEARSIYKDVENLGFSESIVTIANKLYRDVTKNKIFRGNMRKSIIFACIFHAYKISNHPQSHDSLIQVFNLNKKTGLGGLKHVSLFAPKNSKIRTTYITPRELILETMEKFSATKEQKDEVLDLYEQIKNKSSFLNRARPQSVANGVVYYWICSKKMNISLKEFAKKASLSELTINKISKEIGNVLKGL